MEPIKVRKRRIGNTTYLVNDGHIDNGDYYIHKFIGESDDAWRFERCNGSLPKTSREKVIAANLVARDLPFLSQFKDDLIMTSDCKNFLITYNEENIVDSIEPISEPKFRPSFGWNNEVTNIMDAPVGLLFLLDGTSIFKTQYGSDDNPVCYIISSGERYEGGNKNCVSISVKIENA